jgi:hypothetical protein
METENLKIVIPVISQMTLRLLDEINCFLNGQ